MIKWYEQRPYSRQNVGLYKKGITPELLHDVAVINNLDDDIYQPDFSEFSFPEHLSKAREYHLPEELKKWFLKYARRTPDRLLDLSLYLFPRCSFFLPLFENSTEFVEKRCKILGVQFEEGCDNAETYYNICDALDAYRYRHYLDPEDLWYILYDLDEDEPVEF